MAVVDLTVQSPARFGGEVEDITFTATSTDGVTCTYTGRRNMLFLIKNGSGGSLDVVLTGVASNRTFQRATNLTISTGAGETSAVLVPSTGFTNASGKVSFTIADATSLTMAAIELPETPT